MYKGYNLTISSVPFEIGDYFKGSNLYQQQKEEIRETIESMKSADGVIQAEKLSATWFPVKAYDVFISHSHQDEELAISLAGFLSLHFELTSFVDSCVWGHSEQLLKLIDDEYCHNINTNTYDYAKRNKSTSHVYMMLSVALSKMINICPCIIFLNTPHSISQKDYISGISTDSPWIYSEIAMTSIIQRRKLEELTKLQKTRIALDEVLRDPEFDYEIDISHLVNLSKRDLGIWRKQCAGKTGSAALDVLFNKRW